MKLTALLSIWLSVALFSCSSNPAKNKIQAQQEITSIAAIATTLRESGRIDSLMTTLALAEEMGIQDSLTSLIYHQAAIYWYLENDYQKAINLFDKALYIRKKVLQTSNPILAKNHLNLGKCHKYLRHYNQAIDYFKAALTLYQGQADKAGLIEVYREMGDTYDELGDYTTALNYFNQSVNAAIPLDMIAEKSLAGTLYSQGISAINNNMLPESAIFFEKALLLFQKFRDSIQIADTYHELGIVKRRQKSTETALSFFLKALSRHFANKKRDDAAKTQLEIAITYLEMNQLNDAQNYARQTLTLSQEVNKTQLPEIYSTLGAIAQAQQNPDSALFFYQKALQTLDTTFKNNDILANPNIHPKTFNRKIEAISVLAHKADPLSILHQKTQDRRYLQAALETYQLADALVQALRREMHDDQSKYFWNETALPIYKKGNDIAFQLYELTKDERYQLAQLQFAERTKAPVLREGIADNQAKDFAGVPATDRQRERELRAIIAILEKQTETNKPSAMAYLIKTRTELYAFQDSLTSKYPTYARFLEATIKDTPLSINDLKGIQRKLSDSTILIEYAFGETDLYEIAISNIDFKIFKKPFSEPVKAQIERFIQSVSDGSLKKDFNAAGRAYAETSFDLYQYLLETPLKQTGHNAAFKRVHLVPEGNLHLVPFKALTSQRIEGFTGSYPKHFLVRQYAFSTLFSCQTLLQKPPSVVTTNTNQFKLACFGVDFKDSIWRQKTPKPTQLRKKNNILENAEPEVRGIAAQFKGRSYFNQEATKDAFLKDAPNYDFLHITTHGDPEGLIFQKKNATDSLHEVTITDIYGLPLHTRFTFLSACETGQGKLTEAEGVMSLGRAFTYAGSQSVIMSLWSIPDYSTSKIAQQFYTYYHQGLPKDIAEQRAEIYFLDNEAQLSRESNPNHWAAFTIIGDMSPLEVEETGIKWWIWLCLGLGIIGVLFLLGNTRFGFLESTKEL